MIIIIIIKLALVKLPFTFIQINSRTLRLNINWDTSYRHALLQSEWIAKEHFIIIHLEITPNMQAI